MNLHYLCTNKNSHIFDFLEETNDITISKSVGKGYYLNKFMVTEARNFYHINFLAIDIEALKDDEIMRSFLGLNLMYDFRIIIVDKEMKFDSEKFNLYIENKFFNLIYGSSEQIKDYIKKSVSAEGMDHDDHIRIDKNTGRKKYNFNSKDIKIGVFSLHSSAGATSLSFQLANFIVGSSGKALYSEINNSGHLKEIIEFYKLENKSDDVYRYKDVDYYLNQKFSEGYNFSIFDMGLVDNYSQEHFETFDILLFVCGSKPYQIKNLKKLSFENMIEENILLNFCAESSRIYFKEFEKENRTINFLEYAPSLFNEEKNSEVFIKLLSEYIDEATTE